ncbi:hypothetical protein [Falsiphaeobacter marinintestinus]|uniref:hypothetical protein n=1 Tax=Falsiphaeobacter marinintestinus TaxID=1492905 RepID=UPI0011B4EE23|nr:hypothetical protein [Phaeobacter marinintestinus]
MITAMSTYLVLSLITVGALSVMILRIGRILGDCPQTGTAYKAAAVAVATGYAAIGTGGVLLIAAGIAMAPVPHMQALPVALGLAALCLGLGFSNAIATLRGVVNPPEAAPKTPRVPEADAPVNS